MPPFHGHFNETGLPLIEVTVVGKKGSANVLAVIDTGYNGHLTITHEIADKVGLKRLGVQPATLASGIPVNYVEYFGIVVIGDIRVKAVIDVQLKGRVLLGNSFLEKANLCFRCDPHHSLAELNHPTKDIL